MQVGLFGHKLSGNKFEAFKAVIEVLKDLDIKYVFGPNVLSKSVSFKDAGAQADYNYMKEVEFVLTLGGDGTILEAVTLIGNKEIPIIGINLGRLGFLASIDVQDIRKAIEQLHEGNYEIRERRMLQLDSNIPLFEKAPFALNDFTLHKRDTSSMITINAYVDNEFLTAYWADGLIVSTPTGSTGYSLSCGGPIIMPSSGNIVITPVAPHNLNVRPIILSDKSVISFEIEGRSNAFMCSMDSRFEVITKSHELSVRKCDFSTRLVQFEGYSYLQNIRKKMAWGIDRRN